MFGGDLWILLLIVLVLFGAKKLPELARGMGLAIKEFNKAKDEFEKELTKPTDTPPAANPTAAAPVAPTPSAAGPVATTPASNPPTQAS